MSDSYKVVVGVVVLLITVFIVGLILGAVFLGEDKGSDKDDVLIRSVFNKALDSSHPDDKDKYFTNLVKEDNISPEVKNKYFDFSEMMTVQNWGMNKVAPATVRDVYFIEDSKGVKKYIVTSEYKTPYTFKKVDAYGSNSEVSYLKRNLVFEVSVRDGLIVNIKDIGSVTIEEYGSNGKLKSESLLQ